MIDSYNIFGTGSGVTANSLHPGVINTELGRHTATTFPIMNFILKSPLTYFFKNSEQGAQTNIYCAVAEEIEGISGRYFR